MTFLDLVRFAIRSVRGHRLRSGLAVLGVAIGIASVMVLFGTIDQLLTYMGFSLGIFPLLAVFGVFKLRRTGRSAVKLPGYPLASAVYLLAGTAILILAFLSIFSPYVPTLWNVVPRDLRPTRSFSQAPRPSRASTTTPKAWT